MERWDSDSDKRDISAVICDIIPIVSKVMYLIGPTQTADSPIRNVISHNTETPDSPIRNVIPRKPKTPEHISIPQ